MEQFPPGGEGVAADVSRPSWVAIPLGRVGFEGRNGHGVLGCYESGCERSVN